MIDEDADLRERFAHLRAEERARVPCFDPERHSRKRRVHWRMIAVTAALVLIVITTMLVRPHTSAFTAADRAAVRSVAVWHPPTDFLLRTPGSEMLTTTPRIPDLKGIPR